MEPELRELLCVLLDADLRFDLSSSKYPHIVGGAVAAILQEVCILCYAMLCDAVLSFGMVRYHT